MSTTTFWKRIRHFFAQCVKKNEQLEPKEPTNYEKLINVMDFDRNASVKMVKYSSDCFEVEFFEKRKPDLVKQADADKKRENEEYLKLLKREEDAVAELAMTSPGDFEDAVLSKELTPEEEDREY